MWEQHRVYPVWKWVKSTLFQQWQIIAWSIRSLGSWPIWIAMAKLWLNEWAYKRGGKSEEVHESAAWSWIMILALNLNPAMYRLVLGQSWICKRMKAIRFSLINLPARVIERSRILKVRLGKSHASFDWLLEIRRKISILSPAHVWWLTYLILLIFM